MFLIEKKHYFCDLFGKIKIIIPISKREEKLFMNIYCNEKFKDYG